VRGTFILIAGTVCCDGTLAHNGLANDQGRFAFDSFGLLDGGTEFGYVTAFGLKDFPTPGFVLGSGVFASHGRGISGQLDVVGIIKHDQVVESQVTGQTACTL